MNEFETKIYRKILEKMDIDESEIGEITADTPIFTSDDNGNGCMGLDSIDALELVVMIYDEWGIDVPTDDMPKLRTISGIAGYVKENKE